MTTSLSQEPESVEHLNAQEEILERPFIILSLRCPTLFCLPQKEDSPDAVASYDVLVVLMTKHIYGCLPGLLVTRDAGFSVVPVRSESASQN